MAAWLGIKVKSVPLLKNNYLKKYFLLYFKHASLLRDARYCPLSCGTDKISWVTLCQLVYGQLTQHNPTDFAAPHRLGLFATLTAPRKPNLTFHNVNNMSNLFL